MAYRLVSRRRGRGGPHQDFLCIGPGIWCYAPGSGFLGLGSVGLLTAHKGGGVEVLITGKLHQLRGV